ncbi:hypothetical protein ABD67_08665 [Bacillus sonorensis]|nr:hypothetical protein [Bacillus sonorensis]
MYHAEALNKAGITGKVFKRHRDEEQWPNRRFLQPIPMTRRSLMDVVMNGNLLSTVNFIKN